MDDPDWVNAAVWFFTRSRERTREGVRSLARVLEVLLRPMEKHLTGFECHKLSGD